MAHATIQKPFTKTVSSAPVCVMPTGLPDRDFAAAVLLYGLQEPLSIFGRNLASAVPEAVAPSFSAAAHFAAVSARIILSAQEKWERRFPRNGCPKSSSPSRNRGLKTSVS